MELRKNTLYKALPYLWLCISMCACLCSCQKDTFREEAVDREMLLSQGRYLAAGNSGDYALIEEHDKSKWFKPGTPFRLLAYAKPYQQEGEAKFRFNKVAWDGETYGLKFINIDSEPYKWFGFSPIGTETGGTDGLVSLNFYGLTYGKPVEGDRSGYIVLSDQNGSILPDTGNTETSATVPLSGLTRTESVDENGELKDLMYGQLLDQNIVSAGQDASTDCQSILPFKHCFSLLHFIVVQQAAENSVDGTSPYFPGIQITDVTITNTYNSGKVHLENGKIELLGEPVERNLKMFQTNDSGTETPADYVEVTTAQTEIGNMLVFPSDGGDLTQTDMVDGYNIGVEITFKCPDEATRRKFTDSFKAGEYQRYTTEDINGEYYMTIIKDRIMTDRSDNPQEEEVLRFRQNTEYDLAISFQNNMVRIITVVPTVEEWLPGEGTEADPWKEEAIGQPQMFDNIVWSDRNLGADHFDPIVNNGEEFENVVGYFYQSGRNIPYYPYNYTTGETPDFSKMHDQSFADKSMKWQNTEYRFYPIVDQRIIKMTGSRDWTMYQQADAGSYPQMIISENRPEGNYYYDFLRGSNALTNSGLSKDQDMKWHKSRYYQPTSGAWKIPTSSEFLRIFPSTPFAGNITLRDGNPNDNPMNWGQGEDHPINFSDSEQKTVRITVPFYRKGDSKPTLRNKAYQDAWQILHDNEYDNEGSTKLEKYASGWPNTNINLKLEPDGDPRDGDASVYVISGEPQDTTSLSERLVNSGHLKIKTWGTIYAIKRIYTPQAYRMRWRALIAKQGTHNPCIYIEICRYRSDENDHLNEDNYKTEYDWDHPAARLYIPVCGLGDWTGEFINFGTECQYATSDSITVDGKTSAVQIKITGDNASNAYIAVIKYAINRNFAKQIRPIGGANND